MKKYIALIVLFLTMLPAFASAQKTINIQGVVTDSNNETQIRFRAAMAPLTPAGAL